MWQLYSLIPNRAYLAIDSMADADLSSSLACRNLLNKLQSHLQLSGKLIETSFPYFFMDEQTTTWYVSFSHSKTHIAVLLANIAKIGVDIEDKPIKASVAQRYFAKSEQAWLAILSDSEQAQGRQLLWVLKESLIKAQLLAPQLFKGIGADITAWVDLPTLVKLLRGQAPIYQFAHGYVGYLPASACGFVLAEARF